MKILRITLLIISITLFGCKDSSKKQAGINQETQISDVKPQNDFTIVFASCNDQEREQPLWEPIIGHAPDLFIWGGDNIYADTDDMQKMKADYDKLKANEGYTKLRGMTAVIGTWDDHDYGLNDGGVEWAVKNQAQDLFWDFLEAKEDDPLRDQVGVYHKKVYNTDAGSVQVLLLDTRSFRTAMNPDSDPDRRYKAWPQDHEGTVLGAAQWEWLTEQLQDDSHDFTIIVTSIQFLSGDHGYEKWDHFPGEVAKMYETLKEAKAPNVFMLSGDRHHGEIQLNKDAGLSYPLVELTSSGLTHTFPGTPFEPNPYRIGEGTKELNFSVIKLDFEKKQVTFELRGKDDHLFEMMLRQY
ncbi:MAG: alkaline phosphatase D family protein [Gilvibacter sp.]